MYTAYKIQCGRAARAILGRDDVNDDDDPYDLADLMLSAFRQGVPADNFIREMFREELKSYAIQR